MKLNFLCFFAILLIVCACNSTPKKQQPKPDKNENDSITVVRKPYKNTTDVIEYEIPVLKESNIKHGVQKRFYRSGSLYSTTPFKYGKREGIVYTYYQAVEGANPVVWKEQSYKNNMLNGICKRYHRDGQLQAEYEYKDGMPGVGIKEFNQSGNPVVQPSLVLTKNKGASGYHITAQLSKKRKNVKYYLGKLEEGKYLPKGLKSLQVRDGKGEAIVGNYKQVTITAVYTTRYSNKGIVSKTIRVE